MATWRDSDDPRCPACGEKITATAAYCMHCEVDFAPDGSVVSEETTDRPAPSADVSDADDVDFDGDSTDTVRTAGTATAGEDYEATTLLLRAPISLLMGLPGGLLIGFAVLGAAGHLSTVAGSSVFLLGWLGVAGYLLRKPLASDAIGDGFYVYAVVLLVIPLTWFLGDLGRLVLGGTNQTLADATIQVVVMELFFAFPAAFCLLVGYGCNYYARSRIEAALNERSAAA